MIEIENIVTGQLPMSELKGIINILIFSVQPKEGKEAYWGRVVPTNMRFRRCVLHSVQHHARIDTNKVFGAGFEEE